MKYKKIVTYEIEHYPETCRECPAFKLTAYQCHNERGYAAQCELGYMAGRDMRDFTGRTRFTGCRIKQNPNVKLMSE